MDELEEMLNNHIEKSKKEAVLRSVLEKLFQKVGIHDKTSMETRIFNMREEIGRDQRLSDLVLIEVPILLL